MHFKVIMQHIESGFDDPLGGDGDGDGGGGDGDVPTTLPSGQSPGPSRPGTKYPVRGQSLTSIYIYIERERERYR